METLGIYISVPFCRSKCSYCNFASGVFPEARQAQYIERVVADIRHARERAAGLEARLPELVDSIYLGGGTPSILAPELLAKLFAALRSEFAVADEAEITLECAPGQIADEFLTAMLDCGVNRVSFGVQSFVDREAAVTGRLHTRAGALRDIERVRAAGIRSVSADLIAGLPHQTMDSWRESLDVLVSSDVDHASVYMFEIDEDSRLGREVMEGGGRYHAGAVPGDDLIADLYLKAVEVLNDNGLAQYEISNFSRPGSESVHNMKYWLRRPYLGFGLDSHSMLRGVDGGVVRFQSADDLDIFLGGCSLADVRSISRQEELEEAWFLGLRLNAGVSLAGLEREFGDLEVCAHDGLIDELERDGMALVDEGRIRLTGRGRLLSNEVFARFLTQDRPSSLDLVLVD
jgi:oxygen-independent coproporphyrinogen-3 oxidase